jgi:hypothetical protein
MLKISSNCSNLLILGKGLVVGHNLFPEVGMWYQTLDYDTSFEVVALDEKEGYVEVQHFTGEIEEHDLENWFELNLISIEPPEDWTGAYEVSREDLGFYDENQYSEDWSGILTDIDADRF